MFALFGFWWVVAAAAIILVVIASNFITGLRAKLRESGKERDKLEKLSVKHLVQFQVRWLNGCGNTEEWKAVVTEQYHDRFIAEIKEHLIWAKMRDEQWNLPRPFAWIKNGTVESVHFYHLGSACWQEAPEIIDFVYSECVWRRTSELVRSLAADLSPEKGKPLSARELGMLLGYDEWFLDNVRSWLEGGNAGYHICAEQLTNLRAALDEIARRWKYDLHTQIVRIGKFKDNVHPTPLEFVRGTLPGVAIPVLKLLETDEGMKRVLDYILAESDLPKEEPKEASSWTAS